MNGKGMTEWGGNFSLFAYTQSCENEYNVYSMK
jgi:hypothetical protein